jgi:hypothetical protein
MSEFLNKDEFHRYVIDNRDRQDANKREIIENQELGELGGRVEKLEDENTKQNRIAGGITALNAAVIGILAYLK